jgi:peptidoglycan/LPS O-acetylase OafA/YrhL
MSNTPAPGPGSSGQRPATPYLANLTPLRGIAALLTVIFHVDLMIGGGGNMLLKFKDSLLISKFYLMVDFFFVLSGFIMCHVYAGWFKESVQGGSFKQFSIARFARVYPLHLFTLFYLVILRIWFLHTGTPDNPFDASSDTWRSIPTNLLLIQSMNVHNWFSWNNAAWSISTEWWMYMLFPFLVRPFLHSKPIGRLLLIAGCIGGYLLIMFYLKPLVGLPPALSFLKDFGSHPDINVAYQFGFFRCLFGFVLGMIAYLVYKDGWAKKVLGKGWTFGLLALAMFTTMHFGLWDLLSVCFYPFMILSAAYGSKNMNAFFGKKPLQRIGDWSFSIYLVHQPILYTYEAITSYLHPPKPGPLGPPNPPTIFTGWLIALAFIAGTLLIASLTYRFVEIPARQWINKRFRPTHRLPHIKPPATA